MLLTPSPVTNCHTFSDPLPLERDVLYGRPLSSDYQATIKAIVVYFTVTCKPGPSGFPVLKVTNSRSSFGKIPKIPVVKLMTYLHANTFIIARKWPTLTHFYQLHKI